MATYNFKGFAPNAFSFPAGGGFSTGSQFQLDPGWDTQDNAYNFQVSDGDAFFGGDTFADETGNDTDQSAIIKNAAGTTVSSGRVYLETGYSFTDEFGGTVTLYQVEVAGTVVGYISDGPIQPGNVYTVNATVNPGTSDVSFAELDSQTYDEDVANNVVGTSNGDTLTTDVGNDSIAAGAGNDYVDGGAGNDTISGGTGNDTIYGGTGSDNLTGDSGNDVIYGDDGTSGTQGATAKFAYEFYELDGQSLTNLASAGFDANGDNQNLPDGQGYVNTIDLTAIDAANGGNSDTFAVKLTTTLSVTSGGTYAFNISSDDGARLYVDGVQVINNDNLHATTTAGGSTALGAGDHLIEIIYFENFGEQVLNVSVSGPDTGNSAINLSAANVSQAIPSDDTIDGGDGDDTIYGGPGDNSIFGGAGNDRIEYGGGNNTVSGGDGNDLIDDQSGTKLSGTDSVDGGAGNDTIYTGSGDDTIQGGSGDDLIYGEDGNDSIDGGAGNDTIQGGLGDDVITGGDGNDVFVYAPGDGTDTITDFNFGNTGALGDDDTSNNDFFDFSDYYEKVFDLRADFADDGILNQSNDIANGGTVDYSGQTRFLSGDGLVFQGATPDSFTVDNVGVVCFAAGTLIQTPTGEWPVESLRPGDLVLTKDNGPQPLVWSGMRRLDAQELRRFDSIRPIEIKAGSFGNHSPLVVSPQHGILLPFEGEEVMVRAKHLAEMHGGLVRVKNGCRSVTYCHLLFEQHQVIFSNGIPTESFFPGPQALKALDHDPHTELMRLFPMLIGVTDKKAAVQTYGEEARTFLRRAHLPEDLRAFHA